ncbi:MAG: N-6 DNA methylase [Promethearchaeota archaeon]
MKKHHKGNWITGEELQNQFGPQSIPYQLFFEHWKQIQVTPPIELSIERSYRDWIANHPQLSSHLSSESEKRELFARTSYFIWILVQVCLQTAPTLPLNFPSIKPFHFLFDSALQAQLENPKLLKCSQMIPHYSQFAEEEMFGHFMNKLLQLSTQEEKGMFFTPQHLVEFLLEIILPRKIGHINHTDHEEIAQDKIIDPTCGSGAILTEIVKSLLQRKEKFDTNLKKILNIYGIDENPAAIFSTFTNILIQFAQKYSDEEEIQSFVSQFQSHLICMDLFSLDENSNPGQLIPKFDIALGNLPWNVLNNIQNPKLRELIKELAKKHHLFMAWKNQSNLEIATILFEIIRKNLLKDDGFMAFYLPASLLTGTQHAKFRRFTGLGQIREYRIFPDVFPIHTMLLSATKVLNEERDPKSYKPKPLITQSAIFDPETNSWNLSEEIEKMPAYVRIHQKQTLVGKYIVPNTSEPQVIIQKSPYYSETYRGVDITPRKLLFVNMESSDETFQMSGEQEGLVSILPTATQYRSTHSNRWNDHQFEPTKVEKQFLFPVIKSTDLIPYHTYYPNYAFIPIKLRSSPKSSFFELISASNLPPHSQKHWSYIDETYRQFRNPNAINKTLGQSLIYGKKLFQPALTSALKVVYPVGGSYCKAAILREPSWMVDVTLYYLSPKSEEEAYYLLAWLNSDLLNKNLSRVCTIGANGSIRVIHLAPWQFPLPIFSQTSDFIEISNIGRQLEICAHKIYRDNWDIVPNHSIIKKPGLVKIYNKLRDNPDYRQLQLDLSTKLKNLYEKSEFMEK